MKKIVAFDLKSIHLHENFEFLRKVCGRRRMLLMQS